MYGKSGTIGEAGCGPTALAIAVASLTSNQVTPYDVAQWSVEMGTAVRETELPQPDSKWGRALWADRYRGRERQ